MIWTMVKIKRFFVVGFYDTKGKLVVVYDKLTFEQAKEKLIHLNGQKTVAIQNAMNMLLSNKASNRKPLTAPTQEAVLTDLVITLLLNDKIRLKDIPRAIRLNYLMFYIHAFRVDRCLNKSRYLKDLSIVFDDAESCTDELHKKDIQEIYNKSLYNMRYAFIEEE